MEWYQLENFRAVAKTQHISQTAQSLSVSQPALSRSITKLEKELGFPLFERKGKHIVLNRYGKIFLQHVERAMQEVETGKEVIQDMLHPDHGMVSLAFLHSLGSNIVPYLLGKFHDKYPEIQFKLYQNYTISLIEQLETGEIDLCFCSPAIVKETIQWEPLFREELYIAVPHGHPLAHRRKISLAEIANDPVVTFKKDYGLRIMMDQIFAAAGLNPLITFEGEEIWTVAGLVEARLGIALLPRIAVLEKANISFLHIADSPCSRIIELAWIKNRYMSVAATRFRDFVLEALKEEKALTTFSPRTRQ